MQMHNPPHPGEILREEWLVPLGLSVTRAAQGLGVTRKTLSQLVNEHAGVSPDFYCAVNHFLVVRDSPMLVNSAVRRAVL